MTTKPGIVSTAKLAIWRQALTDVEDGGGELNVAKVAGARLDVLLARRARVHAVNGAELGVVEALLARLLVLLVHGLGVDDVHDAHGLDLFGGEQAELDLLDGPERTFRLGGRAGRHAGDGRGKSWVRGLLETVLSVGAGGGGRRSESGAVGPGAPRPRVMLVVSLPW